MYHVRFLEWQSFYWIKMLILLLLLLKRITEDLHLHKGAWDSVLGKSRDALCIKEHLATGSIWRTAENCLLWT